MYRDLGLPIARATAEAHKGMITLSDSPSGGCALTIELRALHMPDPANRKLDYAANCLIERKVIGLPKESRITP